MKNIAAIKRNNRKIHARKFLSTPEGKAWLERKQRENEERKLLSELKWLREDFWKSPERNKTHSNAVFIAWYRGVYVMCV